MNQKTELLEKTIVSLRTYGVKATGKKAVSYIQTA